MMVPRNTASRWILLIAVTSCVAALVLFVYQGYDSSAVGRDEPKAETVYVEPLDVSDGEAVLRWARNVCEGVRVSDAARYLGIEADLEGVVEVLTESIPEPVRQDAIRVCQRHLIP